MVIYIHTYKHTCIQNSQMRLALGKGNTGFSCMKNQLSLRFAAIKYESYILAFKLKLPGIAGHYFNNADVSFIILPRKCINFIFTNQHSFSFVEHFCMKYYTNFKEYLVVSDQYGLNGFIKSTEQKPESYFLMIFFCCSKEPATKMS